MNEKHFGCVVECIDKKVAEGLYSLKKKIKTARSTDPHIGL